MQKFFKDYIAPYYKKIMVIVILVILQVIIQLFILQLTKSIIDNGIVNSNINFIINTGTLMIILTIFYGVSVVFSSYVSSSIGAGVSCDIREALFKKVLSFSQYDFKEFGSSTLLARSTADVALTENFIIGILRNALLIPIVIVALIIATAMINIELCSIIVVSFLLTIILIIIKNKQSIELFTKAQSKLDKLNLLLKEKIEGVRSIRAFGKQDYEQKKFQKINKEYTEDSLFAAYKLYYLTPVALIIMNLAVLVIYFLGSIELQHKLINIGDLILLTQYVTYFISCLAIIPFLVTTLPKALVAIDRIGKVLYYDTTVKNNPSEEYLKFGLEDVDENIIEYKNVIFGYDGAKNVIADINLNSLKGTTTAFIGPTGSGKSTIVYLLNRLYDPKFGEIIINGINIKEIDINELRDKISFCSQKTMVLNDTVYENIAMGNENISRDKAMEVCKLTLFSEVFDFLPNGLDSVMAQGGMNVSGGQKQRLSLARALAKDAEIYVFDDCFSALDAKTEKIVRDNIKKYLKDKTIFMVAQKINTIMGADNIVVLDKGRIVQQGTHEELLKSCNLYQEIYETQSYLDRSDLNGQ